MAARAMMLTVSPTTGRQRRNRVGKSEVGPISVKLKTTANRLAATWRIKDECTPISKHFQ